jgi:hypothetical protein
MTGACLQIKTSKGGPEAQAAAMLFGEMDLPLWRAWTEEAAEAMLELLI